MHIGLVRSIFRKQTDGFVSLISETLAYSNFPLVRTTILTVMHCLSSRLSKRSQKKKLLRDRFNMSLCGRGQSVVVKYLRSKLNYLLNIMLMYIVKNDDVIRIHDNTL